MVSPQNPLKRNLELLDENRRLEMVRLAAAPYPTLRACDFEFHLPRPSYTYHTLEALRRSYPDHEFALIIGEDNWLHFDRWYRSSDILNETPIIVYPRGEDTTLTTTDTGAPEQAPGIRFVQSRLLPYSSTEVREAIGRGDDASGMLHPDVAAYIEKNSLYAPA